MAIPPLLLSLPARPALSTSCTSPSRALGHPPPAHRPPLPGRSLLRQAATDARIPAASSPSQTRSSPVSCAGAPRSTCPATARSTTPDSPPPEPGSDSFAGTSPIQGGSGSGLTPETTQELRIKSKLISQKLETDKSLESA